MEDLPSAEDFEEEDEYGDTLLDRRQFEQLRDSIPDELYNRLSRLRDQIEQLEARFNYLLTTITPVSPGDIVEVQRGTSTERLLVDDVDVYASGRGLRDFRWYASGRRIRKSDGKPGKRRSFVSSGSEYGIVERREEAKGLPDNIAQEVADLEKQILSLEERRDSLLTALSPVKEGHIVRFTRERYDGTRTYVILVDHVSYAGVVSYGLNRGDHVWMFEGRRFKKNGKVGLRREGSDTTSAFEVLDEAPSS